MDPDNYDNYGGVDHVKYCFQVCIGNLDLHVNIVGQFCINLLNCLYIPNLNSEGYSIKYEMNILFIFVL